MRVRLSVAIAIAFGQIGLASLCMSAETGAVQERSVRFVLVGEPKGDPPPVRGRIHLEPVGSSASEPVVVPVESGVGMARLPPGTHWRLTLDVAGRWAPPGLLRIEPTTSKIDVHVWPTGTLRGRFRPADEGRKLPTDLEVSVESPRADARARPIGGGSFTCPIDDRGDWACELPAVALDLVLRVPGFVPVYRWDVVVDANEARDLGAIRLETGASLAGWVVLEDRTPLPERVSASLRPSGAAGPESGLADRNRRSASTLSVGEDGFFQFVGVAPGAYTLEVEASGHGSAVVSPIDVWEEEETQLASPIVLVAPVDLTIAVDPPVDPSGRPWKILVFRASDDSGAYDRPWVANEIAGQDGTLTVPDQPPGTFSIRVENIDADVLWSEQAWRVASQSDADLFAELPLIAVHGKARIGDRPLQADLWFGGRFGERRIRVESDEDGLFEGVLPEGGEWEVGVRSAGSEVNTLLPVDLAPDDDGVAEVEIVVPDTEVYGTVLGPDDNPRAEAQVLLESAAGEARLASDSEGKFRARGLPTGLLTASAFVGGEAEATSEVARAPLSEGSPLGPIVLHLRESRRIEGVVLADGWPLPGAVVSFTGPPGGGFGDSARTDLGGRFSLAAHPASPYLDLVISAPGRSLSSARVQLDADREIEIETPGQAGSVRVVFPDGRDASTVPLRFFQDGTRLSAHTLVQWIVTNGGGALRGEEQEMSLPRMAPGEYRACVARSDGTFEAKDCATGYLAPGGTLDLVMR